MSKIRLLKSMCIVMYLFSLGSYASAQQRELIRDITGQPFETMQYVGVQGSPYLLDEWEVGRVRMQSGKVFLDVPLKYDLVQNLLIFRSDAGQEQLFLEPVVEFEIGRYLFRNGYKPIDGASLSTFYQVLADGGTKLLKRTAKRVEEEVSYGSGPKVKSIVGYEYYYLASDDNSSLVKIKKDRRSVINVLKDKKIELNRHINEQGLDLRQDNDIAKLITFYNSL